MNQPEKKGLDNDQLSTAETPEKVFHYTSTSVFKLIIEGQTLRFGHIRPQNDKDEVTYFQDIAINHARDQCGEVFSTPLLFEYGVDEGARDQKSEAYDGYLISFSEDGDCKSQWKEYGDDYKGVAIGFNSQYFLNCGFERLNRTLTNFSGLFDSVAYETEKEISDGILTEIVIDPVMWLVRVFALQHLYKSPLWKEEREWRLFHQSSEMPINTQEKKIEKYIEWKNDQPTKYSGAQKLPFIKLVKEENPIQEIVLGPHCDFSEKEIRDLLKYDSISIRKSKLQIRR